MNQKDCFGKTLKPWPVFVDHYTISVLSTVINSMSAEPGVLERSYDQAKSSGPLVKFNHPVEEGYEDKLTERILNILSST
ncbi:hypothetical protein BWR12_25960 [Citrobacter braakii]|nr:hypothetical protein BWR12_25960 [Citrobacter braakii]